MLKNTATIIFMMFIGACQSRPMNFKSNQSESQLSVDGIWQSQGYGYLLTFKGNKKKIYDVSKNHCLIQDLNAKEISNLITDINIVDDQTFIAKLQFGITNYHFKKIEKLPVLCEQKSTRSHVEAIKYFIEIMTTHYAYFDIYGVDWAKRIQETLPMLSGKLSEKKAYDIIVGLLSGLNDAHTFLSAEVDGQEQVLRKGRSRTLRPALDHAFDAQNEIKNDRKFRKAWFEEHKKNIESKILKAHYKYAANDKILWGTIGKLGYINLLRMMDLTKSGTIPDDLKAFKKNMNHIMAELKDTEALIIDVTTNSGGHDEIGLAMVGYFTEQQMLAYSKAAQGSGLPAQQVFVKPTKIHYDKPVYLFTSDHTVSAAETFVMAMKNLPLVTHVGDTTRGAFSDVLDKTLPNGWEIGFSNEVYHDPLGDSWEGRGLQPQWRFPVFSGKSIYQSHVESVLALLQKIKHEGGALASE